MLINDETGDVTSKNTREKLIGKKKCSGMEGNMQRLNKKPELLVPAGSLEVLKIGVMFGADAVYIGGELYGLRAKAKNFDIDQMREGIEFAHSHGAKVYVTANITAHNRDIPGIREYFSELKGIMPDALIISDPGVFDLAQEICPEIDIHISTQANNVNYGTYRFWHRQGATRVVSGRELSLSEIKELRAQIPEDLEIESFVHGAMCISYSGRCLLSSFLTGRDANLGACTHPCRWNYYLMEESRPGEYFPVIENERGSFILNSKDLCMIEYIPELVDAGINSFKIEGRMKPALYVAVVTAIYREAIDDFYTNPELYRSKLEYYREGISKCSHRKFYTGFYFGAPGTEGQIYDNSVYLREAVYLGFVDSVRADGYCSMEQKNKFAVGEELEVMRPFGGIIPVKVLDMQNEEGNPIPDCPHAQQRIFVQFSEPLQPYDIIRRESE